MDESFLYFFKLVCYLVCCPFEPRLSNSPPISSYILAFLTASPSLSCISVQIAINVFISSVIHCWMHFSFMFSPFSLILLVDGGKKMAAKISVSGVVAPPIISGRTRRHRFLFLAHLKAGADLVPVFWNWSQLYLCGKRKNWFQNWNQPRTSTGPALVEKGYVSKATNKSSKMN